MRYVLIIFAFCLFFFLVEFIWFTTKNKRCITTTKENFELNCVGENVIKLSEVLINKLDDNDTLEQIKQIKFNPSESSTFNQIINSVFITSPKDKIENLKQSIMLNYVINCKDTKYSSMSKISDIEYLNSNNTDIQKILKKKDTAPGKIINISQILNKNTHI
jgi:hypothetical protein